MLVQEEEATEMPLSDAYELWLASLIFCRVIGDEEFNADPDELLLFTCRRRLNAAAGGFIGAANPFIDLFEFE